MPLPAALATNLLSAVATALAAGVSARLVLRGTRDGTAAFAAALAAGGMSTAWLNATETEVYAASLALGVLTIWAGERAGRAGRAGREGHGGHVRWTLLTAYLMALAVPLHLSALVAAPVAIALAAHAGGGVRWRTVLLLGGALVGAIGASRASWQLAALGIVLLAASVAVPAAVARDESGGAARRVASAAAALVLVAIGASAVVVMLVRAGFDPAINQGNPETIEGLATVVSRRQYSVQPLWPRAAPPWVQLANLGQYADWQVALSTGPTVRPSILRSVGTAAFLMLGYLGALWHWRTDRRSWSAVAGLLACGTIGVLVYLNLRAGPSIGFPGLAHDVVREARERDYFYVFGFWAWGLWAGMGAVVLAREWSRPAWTGVLLALLPIVLNWRAVTRRAPAEAPLPRRWAEALLESTPPHGVLFVAGDNDTYPLWYVQHVRRVRRDVAVVTIPLLATRWYREELGRRHGLASDEGAYAGRLATAAELAADARRQGRAVTASPTLTPDERLRLAPEWIAGAPVYLAGPAGIDTGAARRWSAWVDSVLPRRAVRSAIDPVAGYFRRALDCPRMLLEAQRARDTPRLDSTCNYR
jgi:hypothetical protein